MESHILGEGRKPRPLVCAHCMKLWRESGLKLDKKPKAIHVSEVSDDGKCPICHKHLRSFTG